MSKTVMPHVEGESDRSPEQPTETSPPERPNPDKYTNSGYPAGGDMEQSGKDEYGRTPDQRRQAGLPPENVGEGSGKDNAPDRNSTAAAGDEAGVGNEAGVGDDAIIDAGTGDEAGVGGAPGQG